MELPELPQQLNRLQELVASFYRLGASIDLHQVLRNTLSSATRLMNAAAGSIALIDQDAATLRFVEQSNQEAEKLVDMAIPLGEGICGHVALTGETVRVAEAEKDPRFYDGVDRELGQLTLGIVIDMSDPDLPGTIDLGRHAVILTELDRSGETRLLVDGTPTGTAEILGVLEPGREVNGTFSASVPGADEMGDPLVARIDGSFTAVISAP